MTDQPIQHADYVAECPYCDSPDTLDCGSIDGAMHHFECRSCRCGFSWPVPHTDGPVEP